MYSLEQRTDAIQLFIESGFNENAVIRSLGYPSPTMTIDCLDRDTIRRYRQRMDNLRPGHVWSELAVEDFLHRIGAMARDTDGKLRPTAAGLLMFGHEYEIVREFHIIFWIIKSMTVLSQKMNVGQTVSSPVPVIGVVTFATFTSAYTTGLRRILKCLLSWRVQIVLTTPLCIRLCARLWQTP